MRIGLITSSHNPLPSAPGKIWAPGVNVTKLAYGLGKLGHEVLVFAANDSNISGENVRLIDCGVSSIYRDYPDLRAENFAQFSELFAMYDLSLINKAIKMANEGEVDILHFHDIRRSLFALQIIKTPVLYTFRSNLLPVYDKWLEAAAKTLDPQPTIAALSFRHREQFLKYFSQVEVVYNGVDLDKFSFSREGGANFLFTGRLIPDKGAIEAAKMAVEACAEMDIVGGAGDSDNEKEYFDNLINLANSNKNLHYLGLKDFSDMPLVYQKAKAMIFPLNWKEPFGMTIAEAMASGTPVIAYDSGSTAELIEDGVTGFVLKSGDVQGMVRAIKRIQEMPAGEYLLMRENCRKRVEEKFSQRKTEEGYLKIYKKLTGKQ